MADGPETGIFEGHEAELAQTFPVPESVIETYARDGFVRINDILSPELLTDFRREITRVVRAWTVESFVKQIGQDCGAELARAVGGYHAKAEQRAQSTYARAFTQRMNLWRRSELIATLVGSRRLAQLAADLMRVDGVRLYHDQALYKEAHGGHTPWHVDQFYWPLSTDRTTTVWIPLQPVGLEMGPVCFAPGSHLTARELARTLSISDESERLLGEKMASFEVVEQPFEMGEVSFHSGWTCHRAGPNRTETTRAAFTIIYMDRDIRMIEPQHANHVADAGMWLPGVKPGEIAASPLNPVL